MRRQRVIAAIMAVGLLALPAGAAKYAVLASAGHATADNRGYDSDFWYSLFLAYEALVDHGYSHANITVLYYNGTDFVSKYYCFRNRWSSEISQITDRAMSDTGFGAVLDSLGKHVVTSSDTLLVWWACGHGFDQKGSEPWVCDSHYTAEIMYPLGGMVNVYDTTISRYLKAVNHYRQEIVVWSTCDAGKLLDWLSPTDSTVALAGVQWHNTLQSVVDSIVGSGYSTPDSIGVSGFTMYVAALMNRYQLQGSVLSGDSSGDGYVQVREIRHTIDSLYHVSPYQKRDDYGDTADLACAGHDETYDSVQVLDPGGNAGSLCLAGRFAGDRLRFTYRNVEKGRLTDGGYLHLHGTAAQGTRKGLVFGGAVSLDTTGSYEWTNTLYSDAPVWLDSTGVLTGGLRVRGPSGKVAMHVDAADTARIRGWVVAQNPELQ